jgi:hypothetical protein
MAKNYSNEHGAVLMLVIIFGFLLSTIGLALIYLNGIEEMMAQEEIKNARALYNAEAGAERAQTWLQNLSPNKFPEQSGLTNPFDPFAGAMTLEDTPAYAQGQYRVTVIPQSGYVAGTEGFYVIVSSGIITSGVSGSMDKIKVVRRTMHIWDSGNKHKVVSNSWIEEPMKRIVHP